MAGHAKTIMLYSIQRTYILNLVPKPGKYVVTCNQRIDIPTIEPLLSKKDGDTTTVIIVPCIELAADFLDEFNLEFETNEGVTVLPAKIDPSENPYGHFRYVLVLPRGATGVKSCKLIHKSTGIEVQHNFTFGVMPPPYNYDNALFTLAVLQVYVNERDIDDLQTSDNMLYRDIVELKKRVTALENKAGG